MPIFWALRYVSQLFRLFQLFPHIFLRRLGENASSPKDSRKDTAKSPKCVMIQLLRLIKHKGFDGDELYLFEH